MSTNKDKDFLDTYDNYVDKAIDNYFESSSNQNFILSEENFSKLDSYLKASEEKLSLQINELQTKNKYNMTEISKNQNIYNEKLDQITCLFNNYEIRVASLNQYFTNRLSHIGKLSKDLNYYDNFDSNISFSIKVLSQIKSLSEQPIETLPSLFSSYEEIINGGLEIYYVIKSLYDSISKDNLIFVKNFKRIENGMKDTLINLIKEYYLSNDYTKLEQLFKISEKTTSDVIINTYCNVIIDITNITFQTKSILGKEILNNEDINYISKALIDYYILIEKELDNQFGKISSKIYIIFPENKQKETISIFFNKILSLLEEINKGIIININKQDSNVNDIAILIIENLLPIIKDFERRIIPILNYPKIDIKSKFNENNSIFLYTIISNYIFHEEIYYNNNIIKKLTDNVYKNLNELGCNYQSQKKSCKENNNEIQKIFSIYQEDVINTVTSVNLSYSCKEIESVLKRMQLILTDKEVIDTVSSFIKKVIDTIKGLLLYFIERLIFIVEESILLKTGLIDLNFFAFTRMILYKNEFVQIFTKQLRHIFKGISLLNQIENLISTYDIIVNQKISDLFKSIQNKINNQIFFLLNTKLDDSLYKMKTKKNENYSKEVNSLLLTCNEILPDELNCWLDEYKSSLYEGVINLFFNKMKFYLTKGKISDIGAKYIKVDYERIFSFFEEKISKELSNKVYLLLCLTDFYMLPKETVEQLAEDLVNDKREFDKGIIKEVLNKRMNYKF